MIDFIVNFATSIESTIAVIVVLINGVLYYGRWKQNLNTRIPALNVGIFFNKYSIKLANWVLFVL